MRQHLPECLQARIGDRDLPKHGGAACVIIATRKPQTGLVISWTAVHSFGWRRGPSPGTIVEPVMGARGLWTKGIGAAILANLATSVAMIAVGLVPPHETRSH